jgi:hypothetical protein
MMGFMKWLAEAFELIEALEMDRERVETNPSKRQVKVMLHHSVYGQLRYLQNAHTGDTHIGDAGVHSHVELAKRTGERVGKEHFDRSWHGEPDHYTSNHFHAGHIEDHHIDKIKAHSGGLKGWIKDRHKDMPNAATWKD